MLYADVLNMLEDDGAPGPLPLEEAVPVPAPVVGPVVAVPLPAPAGPPLEAAVPVLPAVMGAVPMPPAAPAPDAWVEGPVGWAPIEFEPPVPMDPPDEPGVDSVNPPEGDRVSDGMDGPLFFRPLPDPDEDPDAPKPSVVEPLPAWPWPVNNEDAADPKPLDGPGEEAEAGPPLPDAHDRDDEDGVGESLTEVDGVEPLEFASLCFSLADADWPALSAVPPTPEADVPVGASGAA